MMKRIALMLLLCLAATTSLFADAKAEARKLAASFAAGAKAGDVDMMVSMYADDAVILPPNMPAMTGRDEIRKYWSGMLAGGPVEIELTMDEFLVDGDLAVDRGTYQVKSPMTDSGKYVVVLRRRDGKWRVVNDIFNASAPMVAAAK